MYSQLHTIWNFQTLPLSRLMTLVDISIKFRNGTDFLINWAFDSYMSILFYHTYNQKQKSSCARTSHIPYKVKKPNCFAIGFARLLREKLLELHYSTSKDPYRSM